jgi:hypothetical protein
MIQQLPSLLIAQLGLLAYEDSFLKNPSAIGPQLATFGWELESIITAVDFVDQERVPYGFVANNGQTDLTWWRGTWDLSEWAEDFMFLFSPFQAGGRVHHGFYEIFNSVQGLRPTQYKAGHSLGGALASIDAGVNGTAALTTFGSPRLFDAEAIGYAMPNFGTINRYTMAGDPIVILPPPITGYAHIGSELEVPFVFAEPHVLPTYIRGLSQ